MRVLSLWQPWASLWVAGEKVIETRSWGTEYRGQIAVHAAKHFTVEEEALMLIEPFRSALERLGFTGKRLPTGAILGTVTLTSCKRMTAFAEMPRDKYLYLGDYGRVTEAADPILTPTEVAFGNYAHGRYGWIADGRRLVLDTPIPYRGGQGLRHLHRAILARLEAVGTT